ncbi:hypothetical protein DFH08DRAFT_929174 [Mycena albidolilacea]|uniref:Uncharacterized protein n=1 Tax=Mycena albidolilacea TaxID=1033008 RepID=A0AAD7AQM3_9AGAR|nr:hypothetical protein DFH08DRAFT_929174 [Mycena albidolilacea]
MCDAISTSMIFGALSLLPGNRYILWALVSTGLIICAANRQRPSHKLGRVEHQIQACEELLKHAKGNCPRNLGEWMDGTRRLLEYSTIFTKDFERARLSASKIQSRLLETHSFSTWEELVEYLQNLRSIMRKINQCAKDVEEIQRSTLLTIETERQREFFEGIKELREIHDTVISASARGLASRIGFAAPLTSCRSYETVTHRFESIATSM